MIKNIGHILLLPYLARINPGLISQSRILRNSPNCLPYPKISQHIFSWNEIINIKIKISHERNKPPPKILWKWGKINIRYTKMQMNSRVKRHGTMILGKVQVNTVTIQMSNDKHVQWTLPFLLWRTESSKAHKNKYRHTCPGNTTAAKDLNYSCEWSNIMVLVWNSTWTASVAVSWADRVACIFKIPMGLRRWFQQRKGPNVEEVSIPS